MGIHIAIATKFIFEVAPLDLAVMICLSILCRMQLLQPGEMFSALVCYAVITLSAVMILWLACIAPANRYAHVRVKQSDQTINATFEK